MERFVDISGIIVRITGNEDAFHAAKGVLENFEVEQQAYDWEMICQVSDTLPKPEGECVFSNFERQVYRENGRYMSYINMTDNSPEQAELCVVREKAKSFAYLRKTSPKRLFYSKDLVRALEAEHLITQNRGILLHSSQIRHGDSAIVFTAASGTGKSTQAELWRKHRGAEIINGDRSALCVTQAGVTAFGIPFCGSSSIRKKSKLPLKAIVCLAQAPETTICRISGRKAFRLLWEGCSIHTWNREDVETSVDTLAEMMKRVPVYHLACRPDESAVEALERLLR